MATAVLTLPLRSQADVLLTRRRARDLAALLQLPPADQIGLSTAVWEVARVAEHGGAVELSVCEPPGLAACVTIFGVPSGALRGVGAVLDLDGLRRLVDEVDALPGANGGATVRLASAAAADAWVPELDELRLVLGSLTRHDSGDGVEIVDELRQQNLELLTAMAALRERERELVRLNADLEDTNRAVTALYAELEQQAGELRERAKANDRFLSTLTHELRTPLYAVRGMTEAILRDGVDTMDDGTRRDVSLIDTAAVEALDLVNDHLDLAKMSAGRTTVRLSDVDVGELFATLRAVVTKLPINSGVGLVFEDPDDVPALRTDAFKLSQILRNFVVNALKFTEAGEIRVAASAVRAGGGVRFAVADTGPGISHPDQARIFQEFVQLGHERQGAVRGTGLGLPLTRRLAGVLGGDVAVHSRLNHGSTFTVTLPVRFPDDAEGVDVVEV